jgi:hypothetical protein
MKTIKTVVLFLSHALAIALLTLLTQVGGVIWLLCIPLYSMTNRWLQAIWKRRVVKLAIFPLSYLIITVFVVPPLAKWQCGRTPLPVFSEKHLRTHNAWYYCLLNHHYVRPEIYEATVKAARRMGEKYPDAVVCYLDANFPFIDGYPLQPHFSHRDGRKIDIALHWTEIKGTPIFGTPKWLGYGAFEMPLPGEVDKNRDCSDSRFRNLELQCSGNYDKTRFCFDAARTSDMIRFFAEEKAVDKILLEPHLKTRLGLSKYDKIRFQGCKAARHDDHIHVQ